MKLGKSVTYSAYVINKGASILFGEDFETPLKAIVAAAASYDLEAIKVVKVTKESVEVKLVEQDIIHSVARPIHAPII